MHKLKTNIMVLKKDIKKFAKKLIKESHNQTTAADIQFYINNAKQIEDELIKLKSKE